VDLTPVQITGVLASTIHLGALNRLSCTLAMAKLILAIE
jgi:hypothetical protein